MSEQAFQDALRVYQSGDGARALSLLLPLCADPRAANLCGHILTNGIGTPRDHGRAIEFFKASAKHSFPPALFNLATHFLRGIGMAPNVSQGVQYLILAANNGHTEAQFQLGSRLFTGQDIQENAESAFLYFLAAAQSGHLGALFCAAMAYRNGTGVARDHTKAFVLMKAAAEAGLAAAQLNLGMFYARGIGTPRDLSAAIACTEQAQANGDEGAAINLEALRTVRKFSPLFHALSAGDVDTLLVSVKYPDATILTVDGSPLHNLAKALADVGWVRVQVSSNKLTVGKLFGRVPTQIECRLTEAGKQCVAILHGVLPQQILPT